VLSDISREVVIKVENKVQEIDHARLKARIRECHRCIRSLAAAKPTPETDLDLRAAVHELGRLTHLRLPTARNYAITWQQARLGAVKLGLVSLVTGDSLELEELLPAHTRILTGDRMKAQPALPGDPVYHTPLIWVVRLLLDYCGAALQLLHEIGHLYSAATTEQVRALSRKRRSVNVALARFGQLQRRRVAPDFTDYRCLLPLDEQRELYRLEDHAEEEAGDWAIAHARELEPTYHILAEIGDDTDVALYMDSCKLTHWLTQQRNMSYALESGRWGCDSGL